MQIISKVKKYINPDIKIDNMFFTLVDSRTKSTMEALKSNFGNQIRMYRTLITFLYQVDFSRCLRIIELGTKTTKKLYEVI